MGGKGIRVVGCGGVGGGVCVLVRQGHKHIPWVEGLWPLLHQLAIHMQSPDT